MLAACLLSFGVIFVAELGDKSQLMAMTFALRYRWWLVLGGITAATFAVHLLSVVIGYYLGAALPTHLIAILGGIAFLGFALWTLRGDQLSATEAARAQRRTASAFIAVSSAFLLAELGDKTMLATITLAADHDVIGVWIGSTLGMVTADGLAIAIGRVAGRHLPEQLIARGAAALFAAFGLTILAAEAGTPVAIGAAAITLIAAAALIRSQQRQGRSAGQPVPAASVPAGQPLGH